MEIRPQIENIPGYPFYRLYRYNNGRLTTITSKKLLRNQKHKNTFEIEEWLKGYKGVVQQFVIVRFKDPKTSKIIEIININEIE